MGLISSTDLQCGRIVNMIMISGELSMLTAMTASSSTTTCRIAPGVLTPISDHLWLASRNFGSDGSVWRVAESVSRPEISVRKELMVMLASLLLATRKYVLAEFASGMSMIYPLDVKMAPKCYECYETL